ETQPALALARPPVDIFGETRASPGAGAGAGAGVAAGIGRCPAGRTADAAPGRLDRILDRSHVGLGRRAGVGVRRFDLWRRWRAVARAAGRGGFAARFGDT